MTPRFRLVHLDLDGTLVDSRADLRAATNHMRCRFGQGPLSSAQVDRLVGHGARALVERALGPERSASYDAAVEVYLEHYTLHCLDQTLPFPGLVEAMDDLLPLGVQFSVVTNKTQALSRRILDGLGLSRRLVGLVGGDTFPECKPDPRGIEHVRALTGLGRDACLMVGDSAVDVETARAGGIASCGVVWGFDPAGMRAAGPDYIVTTAAELVDVVRG